MPESNLKVIIRAPEAQLDAAMKVVKTYRKYYDKPNEWQKWRIKFDKVFQCHETRKNTIVVNYIGG